MRKTTNNIKRRNNIVLLVTLICMFSLMLSACGSKEEPATKVETSKEVKEEVVDVPETTVVEEETVEETVVAKEPEKELYIPEGIDITSTLPGQEWLDTFVGNVNEPVAVVFNDNTGRKEVIQGKSEVGINPDEDRIAIFLNESDMSQMLYNIFPKDLINTENYTICILDPVEQRNMVGTDAGFTIYSGDEECAFIEFEIILE